LLGTVDAGSAPSSCQRSRHAAEDHVTLPTTYLTCIVIFNDAVIGIENDGQHRSRIGIRR